LVRILLGICTAMTVLSSSALAHEYYLQPESFSPALGSTVGINQKLGNKFKGNNMPWINKWNVRSEVWHGDKVTEVKGLDGDRPALSLKLEKPGVHVVLHRSNVDTLTFKTWEKFENYANKEGLEHALKPSEEGLKPKINLKESYSRFAKTLVHVDGDTKSLDQPTGLKIELVALANPLALKSDEPMPVLVLYDDAPLAGVAVKVFEGIGQDAAYKVRTDKDGKANIKPAGKGPYLIGAIHITEPQSEEAKTNGSHWESFWASLTFERAQ